MRNETGTVIPSYTVILNAPRLPKKPALTITPFEEKPPTVAQYSERALKDGDGNEISKTYVKKAEIINRLKHLEETLTSTKEALEGISREDSGMATDNDIDNLF